MISVEKVSMLYPVPKGYIDYLKKPFKQSYVQGLKDATLTIQKGDRIALLGHNGAGKTTLLKLIGGLLYPSSGKIEVNGYDIVKNNLDARSCTGYVLNEERSFYWRLTGQQNLQFFGALNNLYGKKLDYEINEVVRLVGLEDAKNRLFAGYSSGMKQRLAIARGLLNDPDILVLDEPTRTLDPISSQDIKKLISKKIHQEKERTLLIATHSLEEAEFLCNKVCVMKKGQIVWFKSMAETISSFTTLGNCYQTLHEGLEKNKVYE